MGKKPVFLIRSVKEPFLIIFNLNRSLSPVYYTIWALFILPLDNVMQIKNIHTTHRNELKTTGIRILHKAALLKEEQTNLDAVVLHILCFTGSRLITAFLYNFTILKLHKLSFVERNFVRESVALVY